MANTRKDQQETLSNVSVANVINKVLSTIEFYLATGQNIIDNPIRFLLDILSRIGVTTDELREWLTTLLVTVVPAMELAVKAALLTNLKNMVSCSTDPRIPNKYRKLHKAATDYNTSQEYGIDISLESIDFFNKLSINPLSEEGKNWYFGLNDVTDVYKFARAEDFDAFLWFVMHKGHFPNSFKVTNFEDTFDGATIEPSSATLLNAFTLTYTGNTKSTIFPGNTFVKGSSGHTISLCIDSTYDKDNYIVGNTLVPVSDDWNSVNWYVRNAYQFTRNMGFGGGNNRDYNKEHAIFNLQFLDQATSTDSPLTGLVNNKFRFTILPKPYIHVPNIDNGEPPWRFKKLLFDADGNYDLNGKYTISEQKETDVDGKYCSILDGAIKIYYKSGDVVIVNKNIVKENLFECYKGLTIYEFNYDYVMSLKLFDAKVIATTLLNAFQNLHIAVDLDFELPNPLKQKSEQLQAEIKEIIKNIINSDDSSTEDCFFTFSNEKYDALLKNAEKKYANRNNVEKVVEILNEYDDNAELNEQINVLNRAITQVSVNISEGVDESDKQTANYNFTFNLIEELITILVECVLSPKVMMLMEVNETIMGGKWQKITPKDLIMAMRGIITSIAKEVRDLVLEELLKLTIEELSPIIATLHSAIVKERFDSYVDVLNDLLRNCPFLWFRIGGGQYSNTVLDVVDYADIEETKEPKINNC